MTRHKMQITTKKLARGRYLISREDGRQFEAHHGVNRWWVNGIPHKTSLRAIKFNIQMAYSPYLRKDEL